MVNISTLHMYIIHFDCNPISFSILVPGKFCLLIRLKALTATELDKFFADNKLSVVEKNPPFRSQSLRPSTGEKSEV